MTTYHNAIQDIVEIVNDAIHNNAPLNMYHVFGSKKEDGIIYIRLTYTMEINKTYRLKPMLEIYSELLFGDFAYRNGDSERKVYCIRFGEPIDVNDLVEMKGTTLEKLQYYINNDLCVQLVI